MNKTEHYLSFGFWCSVGLHLAATLYFLFGMPAAPNLNSEIFTVDVISGSTLGGISQAPTDDKPVAPVAGKQQEETKVEEKVEEKEDVKEELETEEDPDALRLDDQKVRKKETPTPTPKPTATPKPIATPAPKKSATPEPTSKATPAPKKQTAQDINNAYQQAMAKALGESVAAGGTGVGSTGRGGKGYGGGTGRSPEWIAYYNRLTAYVKKGWNWHDSTANLSGSVSFDIAPDGKISNVRLSNSSGDSVFDTSILRAVNKANPVPIPPASVYEDFKSSKMNFKPE